VTNSTVRALTEEDELEVVLRYKVGASAPRLAERFGVHEATIRRALDRAGVSRRPRQAALPVTRNQVAVMRVAGYSWREIAERLHCSPSTARNRWREFLAEEVHGS
jgi:DNA-directed RNA polymerase specialized sigma24 family protein